MSCLGNPPLTNSHPATGLAAVIAEFHLIAPAPESGAARYFREVPLTSETELALEIKDSPYTTTNSPWRKQDSLPYTTSHHDTPSSLAARTQKSRQLNEFPLPRKRARGTALHRFQATAVSYRSNMSVADMWLRRHARDARGPTN